MSKFPQNDAKFKELRALNLPLGRYAVTSSGPLGIREIRAISDIDLVLDDDLWDELSAKYPVVKKDGVHLIQISENIEALGKGSFFVPEPGSHPSMMDQIHQAEVIDGLPFVNLRHILYFKKLMNRPKDAADIEALEQLLKESK